MVLVVIVGIGQVTDSLDKTINFSKQHFSPSRLEATLEQKSQLIDEALKSTHSLFPKNSTKKNSIYLSVLLQKRQTVSFSKSKSKSKIRTENTNQKVSSPFKTL